MSPTKLHLEKRESRGKFRMSEIGTLSQRTSARWAIKELPGVTISQGRILLWDRDHPDELIIPKGWSLFNVYIPYDECTEPEILLEDTEPKFHPGIKVWLQLQGQVFATRKELLEAIEAALMFIEAE